jgi:signal transduction histidine kinase
MLTPESVVLVQVELGERIRAFLANEPASANLVNELGLRHKNGSTVYTETVTTFLKKEDGGISIIGVSRDITERKRAEEALRWRTALFEALMDSSPEGVLIVNNDGHKVFQNERMREIWKIPTQVFLDPDDSNQVQFATSRTRDPIQFSNKIAYLYAHPDEVCRDQLDLADGTVLDRYSSPVWDKHGKCYGRTWLFRDVTKERQLEASLRQAQKIDAVGQLVGGVAHDFNNILTAILMHLGMLQTDPQLPSHLLTSLKEVENESLRATNLTRQLLLFSRRNTALVEPIDLDAVISNLIKMLRRLLGEIIQVTFQGCPIETRIIE